MRTNENTPTAGNGFGGRHGREQEQHPIRLTLNRQSQSSLNRDLSIVRERLAKYQSDPLRSKLTRLLDHLRRQIERELQQARGAL